MKVMMNDEEDRQYHALLLRMDSFLLCQWHKIRLRLNSINQDTQFKISQDTKIQAAYLLGQFSALSNLMAERSEGNPRSDYLFETEGRNALIQEILTHFGLKIEWRWNEKETEQ